MRRQERIMSAAVVRCNRFVSAFAGMSAILLVALMCVVRSAPAETTISSESAPPVNPSSTPPATRTVTMPATPLTGGDISPAGLQNTSVIGGGGGGAFDTVISPGATLASPAYADALAAFNRAAAIWESHISDPITVTIDADLASLPAGVLGSTSSFLLQAPYTEMRNALVADASDEPDDGIVAHLPTLAQFSARVPMVAEGTFEMDGNIVATKANFKALGYTDIDDDFPDPDATITFSTNFNFDYDNSDGVDFGKWDFETIAVHEIGHALGFISRVDYVDYLMDDLDATFAADDTVAFGIGTLDMFAFADDEPGEDPSTNTEFTNFQRLLVPNIDRITDQLSDHFDSDAEILMSEGRNTGDGRQASHWKDNSLTGELVGVMDPTFPNGTIIEITDSDLRAFDLIGYEISIPEPATLGLLTVGAAGLLLRRRRIR